MVFVDPYTDMQVATAINGVIGGGRQFLNDFKLEMELHLLMELLEHLSIQE